jgi:protoheme IX farnesyltransferase
MSDQSSQAGTIQARRSLALDLVTLTKPELTLLSVVSALGGAYLASPTIGLSALLHTFLGTFLVGGGAGALNQYAERNFDALMRRTENRPVPSGRIHHHTALVFGLVLSAAGIIELAVFTYPLAAFLSVLTLASYLLLYTPLKRATPFATVVGGIPGALPPMIGWAAVTGELTMGAWSLFFILFFWQMPHFLALGWMYRKDYARAEYKILTVVDPTGEVAGRQVLVYSVALIPAAAMPTMVGTLGILYFVGAMILSGTLLYVAIGLYRERSSSAARRLFFGSLLYLSLLIGLMIADRIVL